MSRYPVSRRQVLRTGGASLLGTALPGVVTATTDQHTVWQFETGDAVQSSPTVVDGTVYVGSDDASVYAVDATDGEAVWRVDTASRVRASPSVVSGAVVTSTRGGTIAVGLAGEPLWTRHPGTRLSPTVSNGQVFFVRGRDPLDGTGVQAGGRVLALSAGTGQTLWQADPPTSEFGGFSAPTVVDGTVYAGGGGQVSAFEAETGDRVWRVETDDPSVSAPTVADGTVFVGSGGHLHAIADGEQLWTVEPDGFVETAPTVADGTVFAHAGGVTDRSRVHALDTATGSQRWVFETGTRVEDPTVPGIASAPTVVDGTVVVGGPDGRVYGIDIATGETVWSFETGGPIRSSPTVVDGVVFVGSTDGSVYAFDAPFEGRSTGSRVSLGTLGHHGAWADQAPTAVFSYRPENPATGETVTFDATRSGGEMASYEWDITGDGETDATGPTPVRTFETPGRREVSLTVTDGGATATTTETVDVRPPLRWSTGVGESVRSSPTVVEGTVYIGGTVGVSALSATTGERDWTRPTDGVVVGAPTVVDGTVYAGTATVGGNADLYALDSETGQQRWTTTADGLGLFRSSSPTVIDNTLYIGTGGRGGFGSLGRAGLLAVATGDGTRQFVTEIRFGVQSSPTVANGIVYVGTDGVDTGTLSAIDAETGTSLWQVDTDMPLRSSATVADGAVIIGGGSSSAGAGGGEGRVYARDAATGAEVWTVDPGTPVLSTPTVADGTVYLGGADGTVRALSAATGERLWTAQTGDTVESSPTVVDGTVYVGSRDSRLYAFDTASGAVLWTLDTGSPVVSSPTVVEGTVYVGNDDGTVYALNAGVEGDSEGSRVALGTLGHHGSWADQAPTAMLRSEPRELAAGEQLTLDGSVSTGDIEGYDWTVGGDGGPDATGPIITRTVDSPGTTTVSLTVTDATGETATVTRRLSVSPQTRWRYDADREVRASPTIVDGTVYVGDSGGVYALDTETGAVEWEYRTAGRVRAAPVVVDGVVFVGCTDEGSGETLYALDAATGDRYWSANIGESVSGSPAVVGGNVFVGTDDGTIYAFAAVSGGRLWSFDTDRQIETSPTVADNTIYVGGGSVVYALDRSGDPVWTFDIDGTVSSSPTVANGIVYIGSTDANVYALDTATGDLRWSFETAGPVESSPTVANGTVYVGSNDENLYALDAVTGDREWVFETAGPVESSPTVASGIVYIGSNDRRIYAVAADTGERRWRRETDGQVPSSPTVADGTLYAGTGGRFDLGGLPGAVYALVTETTASSAGSRARLGTLGHHDNWRYADQTIDIASGGDGSSDESGDGGGSVDDGGRNGSGGDDSNGEDGSGPGLGPGTALAGLGTVAYLLRRRLRETGGAAADEGSGG